MRVIDAHCHAFPDKVAPGAMAKLVAGVAHVGVKASFDGTVAGLLASMDRAGIERAVICSVATRPEQVEKITDWSAVVTGERIVAFGSVHPDFEKPEAELERMAAAGVRGIKIHPQYMNCPLDDARMVRIARGAARTGLVMVAHAGDDLALGQPDLAVPMRVRALHEAAPGLRLMACHMGGWRCWEESLEVLAGLPIWLETSYTLGQCPEELLLRLIEKHGARRVSFGTDAPWADQGTELERLRALPLSDGDKRRILWDNTAEFLGDEQGKCRVC